MVKRCICEICTCGRHRCPHRPTNLIGRGDQPCTLSEYSNTYKQHPIPLRESFKPSQEPIKGGLFEDKTTQRSDYIRHPLERPFVHQGEAYKKPEGDMDTTTSYKKDYTEKHAERARAYKPVHQLNDGGKFEGEPTYKADYRKWDLGSRPGPYGEKAAWHPPEAPLESETTMKHDYTKHPAQERYSCKPVESAWQSDVPLDDKTRYREDYIKHPLQEKYYHEKEKFKPSTVPMESQTTFKNDYKGQQGDKTKSFKPDSQAFQSQEPFDDDTTHRIDYRKWPVEKPHLHAPEQYTKPLGEMEHVTSYKQEYTPKHTSPVRAIRHDGMPLAPGKFEGEPTYKADYRKWDLGSRPAPYGEKAAWHPPEAPFMDETTMKHDYTSHPMAARESFKPLENTLKSDVPFDDKTRYREDYIKHPLQEKYLHEKEQYKPSNAPMENETTFKRDYRGQQGDKTKSFKPDSQAFQSHEPFDDDTTHRIDYRKWPLEKPYARALSQYVKPEGLMDTMTTHKSTYTIKPIERIIARRPGTSSMTKSAPFDGITSYLTDYRKWGLGDRNKPLIRAEYVPNMAPFEGLSSYKMHYVPHELSKSHSYRPDGTAFRSDAQFDDMTMYRTDYTPKRLEQCEAAFLDKTNSRYIFVENDSRGHRLYQPVMTTITPLAQSPIKQTGMVLPPLITVS